jgi:hypothetical protein
MRTPGIDSGFAGSMRHAPFSDPGCVLLVKLRQFQGRERNHVCHCTGSARRRWAKGSFASSADVICEPALRPWRASRHASLVDQPLFFDQNPARELIIHGLSGMANDLIELWDYIAEDSVTRTDAFIVDVDAKFHLLAEQPMLGRSRRRGWVLSTPCCLSCAGEADVRGLR